MESKKICLVAPSLQGGGIERAMTTLADHFVKRGYQVYYVACRAGNHFYELNNAVDFREPDFKHYSSGIKKLLTYWNTVRFLKQQYKVIRPDVILSFGDIINPLALLANRRINLPIYISDRISPKQQLSWDKNFLKRITYRSATGIIAQSSFAANYKKQMFGDNINVRVIPNSLRKIKDCSELEKQNWVIGIGRLSHEKGFDRLIDAFAKIDGHKDWKLVLAGDGPARKQLEQQTEEFGLTSRIEFLGMRKDVDELLAQSKIFVIPSRCEGFPNALCEAMASPLPCIAYDSIAADLIENGKNGIVLPEGDIDALATEMTRLMDDETLRDKLVQNAYSIRNTLDKDKVGDMFLDFILE